MTFKSLTQEAFEDELRRVNDVLISQGFKMARMRRVLETARDDHKYGLLYDQQHTHHHRTRLDAIERALAE